MSSTEMDGFIGCAVAAESISDATTILHGPGGCRIHLSRLSARYIRREFGSREGDYFFHHERVPCTFIDRDDYIYGASKKVAMILDVLERDDTQFATIIQSPGASLIGDKLRDEVSAKGFDDKTLIMGSSFMSERFSVGYDSTLTAMAEKIVGPMEKVRGTVNIIGLPFTARGYYELQKELRAVLRRMGLEVTAVIGCGCTLDEFRRSSSAEFNICILPEYCERFSGYYEREFGIPTVKSPMGAPIGYRSMETFLRCVGEATGKNASPLMEELEEDRRIVDIALDSSMNVGELLRYKTFSIEGESSVVYPLMMFMMEFLRMVPHNIVLTEEDGFFVGRIRDVLSDLGCDDVLCGGFDDEYTNVMFGPGAYVKLLQSQDRCGVGVDISLPSRDMIDIAPKSVIGLDGLHRMLDEVLNSRRGPCDDPGPQERPSGPGASAPARRYGFVGGAASGPRHLRRTAIRNDMRTAASVEEDAVGS